jgi:hypothetical protein
MKLRQPTADDSQNGPLLCQPAVIARRLMWRGEGRIRIESRAEVPDHGMHEHPGRPVNRDRKRCLFPPFGVRAEP